MSNPAVATRSASDRINRYQHADSAVMTSTHLLLAADARTRSANVRDDHACKTGRVKLRCHEVGP